MYVKLKLSITSKLGVPEEQAHAELSATERTFFSSPPTSYANKVLNLSQTLFPSSIFFLEA